MRTSRFNTKVVRSREPATFRRENVTAIVTLGRMGVVVKTNYRNGSGLIILLSRMGLMLSIKITALTLPLRSSKTKVSGVSIFFSSI